jgi:hypothetical protein
MLLRVSPRCTIRMGSSTGFFAFCLYFGASHCSNSQLSVARTGVPFSRNRLKVWVTVFRTPRKKGSAAGLPQCNAQIGGLGSFPRSPRDSVNFIIWLVCFRTSSLRPRAGNRSLPSAFPTCSRNRQLIGVEQHFNCFDGFRWFLLNINGQFF